MHWVVPPRCCSLHPFPHIYMSWQAPVRTLRLPNTSGSDSSSSLPSSDSSPESARPRRRIPPAAAEVDTPASASDASSTARRAGAMVGTTSWRSAAAAAGKVAGFPCSGVEAAAASAAAVPVSAPPGPPRRGGMFDVVVSAPAQVSSIGLLMLLLPLTGWATEYLNGWNSSKFGIFPPQGAQVNYNGVLFCWYVCFLRKTRWSTRPTDSALVPIAAFATGWLPHLALQDICGQLYRRSFPRPIPFTSPTLQNGLSVHALVAGEPPNRNCWNASL